MGLHISKQYTPTVLVRFQPNLMTNIQVIGQYKAMHFLVIC